MRFLALFLLVVAYKFLTNLMHYFRIKKLQTYFSEFLEHKRSDMNLYRQEVLSLFEKAHVKDIKIPVSEHIGNRKFVSGNVSTFSMFPSTRTEFSVTVLNMFEEAEGVFRKNMLDSFNPFYWIDLIVFLPKSLLSYIGISSEVTAYKICNVLFTFIWWILGILVVYFKPQLQDFVIKLVRNL